MKTVETMTTELLTATESEPENDLLYIQANLTVPKARRNDFGGFNYRNCEDIVNALKPLLDERGCTLTIQDDIMVKGEGENSRFYFKAIVIFRDSFGAIWESYGFAREPLTRKGMDESQISGSASSYARKYALSGLFLLDDSVDPDEVIDITEIEAAKFTDLVENEDGVGLYMLQIEEYPKFCSLRRNSAPKGGKTKFINLVNELILKVVADSETTANRIIELLEKDDKLGIQEVVDELSREEKIITWRSIPDSKHPQITALMKQK